MDYGQATSWQSHTEHFHMFMSTLGMEDLKGWIQDVGKGKGLLKRGELSRIQEGLGAPKRGKGWVLTPKVPPPWSRP